MIIESYGVDPTLKWWMIRARWQTWRTELERAVFEVHKSNPTKRNAGK